MYLDFFSFCFLIQLYKTLECMEDMKHLHAPVKISGLHIKRKMFEIEIISEFTPPLC